MCRLFGSNSLRHPSIMAYLRRGDYCLTSKGPMRFIRRLERCDGMDHYRLPPLEIKTTLEKRGNAIIAAQID